MINDLCHVKDGRNYYFTFTRKFTKQFCRLYLHFAQVAAYRVQMSLLSPPQLLSKLVLPVVADISIRFSINELHLSWPMGTMTEITVNPATHVPG